MVCFALVVTMADITCSAYDCDSMESDSVSLHASHKDVKLRQKWIQFSQRHYSVSVIPEKTQLCSFHFWDNCFDILENVGGAPISIVTDSHSISERKEGEPFLSKTICF